MRAASRSMQLLAELVLGFYLAFMALTGVFAQGHKHYYAPPHNVPDYKNELISYKDEIIVPPPCPLPCFLKDGIYLGAQAGYDAYRVRESFSLGAPVSAFGNPTVNATGWVGGLFLGFGQYLNDVAYLGAEVFANYSDALTNYSLTTSTGTYTSEVRVRQSFGAAFLPGVALNDVALGYVRLGYNYAKIISHENTTGSASTNKTHYSNGFNFGLGIETLLHGHWSLRTEYSHTYYNSFSSGLSTSFNPSDNQFMLSILYHFGC